MATARSAASTMTPSFLETERKDGWWVQPVVTFTVLTAFVAYATFRVFEIGPDALTASATHGRLEYHSPFGSPDLTFLVPGFLAALPLVGRFLTYPSVIILPFVAGFRFTCYYYRKAYYRSFVARPAGCSVGAAKMGGYKGEKGILVVQNVHRYFFYAALVVLSFNLYDTVLSVVTPEHEGLYFGLGSAIMVVNVALLSAYTLGCHSLRHLVGGRLDCFSCDAVSHARHTLWGRVTMLNKRHMLWAWCSLVWVALTDLYIRYVATSGITHVWGIPA